jgi:CTP synthase (UTP-ammonia lyase)
MKIALVGDYNPSAKAHQAIPLALSLASDRSETACEWEWLPTRDLRDDPPAQLAAFDGVWCVPGSPYDSRRGAVSAIRFARETGRPFLGTCGGFQHALLEYAESIWGMMAPAHAEDSPDASDALISPLSCSLVEQSGDIQIAPGTRIAAIYGVSVASEDYHCRYGLNPRHSRRLESGPLRVAARDLAGEVRAIELDGHPFFVATLFQPERSALKQRPHPLIRAFVEAARTAAAMPAGMVDLTRQVE